MRTRQYWDDRLGSTASSNGFSQGYKLLYSPWSTLSSHKAIFLSLNPGTPPVGAELSVVSDERGNSYEVERDTTMSPITLQFLKMCDFMGIVPKDVLTGVVAPFRSGSWSSLSNLQRRVALEIGREFWSDALRVSRSDLIVVCSEEASEMVVSLSGATITEILPAGWGNISIVKYSTSDGRRIVKLPHLSRFRLFGRAASEPHLRKALLTS